MAETIEIPHVGSFKKQQVMVVGSVAAGILVYAWWRARSTPEDTGDGTAEAAPEDAYEGLTNTGFGGDVRGYDDNDNDNGTSGPLTNAEWTVLVKERLADSFDQSAISAALGRYLGRQALSTLDQEIVQAAIAVAGYPPVGSYSVIPGGNAEMKVAPSGLKGTAHSTSVDLTWVAVPGAHRYRIYQYGIKENVGTSVDTKKNVGGLDPGKEYRFAVAAESSSGQVGPASSWVSVKTSGASLKAPSRVKASATGKTTVKLTWSAVSGADGYRAYRKGVTTNVGASRDTSMVIGGLKAGTRYYFKVAATAGNTTGPGSGWVSVTTKR